MSKIRHNDLSERHLEESEKLSPKELYARTAGENHKDDFRTENVQLSASTLGQIIGQIIVLTIVLGFIIILVFWR